MKRCKSCRGALIPKSRETKLQFERRDYCSKWCRRKIEKGQAGAGRGYHMDHSKVCPICGKTFYRPRNKTVKQFDKRKACSQSCAAKRRQREILLEAEREAGRVTEEQRAQELEEVKSEVSSLNYYLQSRRERQEEQWRRQLWQAMLQAPRR